MKAQLRKSILDLLIRVEKDSGFSHLLLDREIRSQKLDVKDEALLTQIVYGTLERKLTLDFFLDAFIDKKKKIEPWVRMLLRMSIYQMVYLDRIPDHAIVNDAVEIAKERGHKGIQGLVNGVLRNVRRKGVPPFTEIADPKERLSIETSHPLWLVERWIESYGFEKAAAICRANLDEKYTSVRIQPLKITRDEAIKKLEEEGYEAEPSGLSQQGIIIKKGNILNSSLFKDGKLTIQDQSSMLVGEMLRPEPGMAVLDSCSAPGGKATHLAEKMENQGTIHAHDLHKKKVELINNKADTLGLSIIQAEEGDARKLQEKYEPGTFDRILVDAPCSGLGVIGSKPEIKYEKTEEDIARLKTIQLDILHSVAPLLKDDGMLVYSTCTVIPDENEKVVQQFLEMHPEFTVDRDFFTELPETVSALPGKSDYGLQLFPDTHGTDGFFLTRLKKV